MKKLSKRITKRSILLQYRHWLKLVVLIPKSMLVQMNEHLQMNERALFIVRQKFREGAIVEDPERIRVLVQEGERSLTMMRNLANNKALLEFPQRTKPPLNYFSLTPIRHIAIENMKAYAKEFYYNYIKKRW